MEVQRLSASKPAFNVVFFLPPIEVNFSWKERWSGSNNLVGTMQTFAHSSVRRGNDTALKCEHLMSESARCTPDLPFKPDKARSVYQLHTIWKTWPLGLVPFSCLQNFSSVLFA